MKISDIRARDVIDFLNLEPERNVVWDDSEINVIMSFKTCYEKSIEILSKYREKECESHAVAIIYFPGYIHIVSKSENGGFGMESYTREEFLKQRMFKVLNKVDWALFVNVDNDNNEIVV